MQNSYYESEDELSHDLRALGATERRVTVGLSYETWDGIALDPLKDAERRSLGPIALDAVRSTFGH